MPIPYEIVSVSYKKVLGLSRRFLSRSRLKGPGQGFWLIPGQPPIPDLERYKLILDGAVHSFFQNHFFIQRRAWSNHKRRGSRFRTSSRNLTRRSRQCYWGFNSGKFSNGNIRLHILLSRDSVTVTLIWSNFVTMENQGQMLQLKKHPNMSRIFWTDRWQVDLAFDCSSSIIYCYRNKLENIRWEIDYRYLIVFLFIIYNCIKD